MAGVGELFFRDSGPASARRGTVLLLHGWIFPADPNWFMAYQPLVEAGYRVIALDHRGHGRGLRAATPFRLADCAADAAALLRHLEAGQAIVAGYSMGGAIAQLMARNHPEQVEAVVLCATALEWRATLPQRLYWRTMIFVELGLRLLPRRTWIRMLRRAGDDGGHRAAWVAGELSRGSPGDLAEAGRELGRFDSRPWIGDLRVPVAVVCTTADRLIPPARQRRIAELAADSSLHEAPLDHGEPAIRAADFVPVLLQAVASAQDRAQAQAQGPA